jgi:hypothetical protein
VKKIKRVWLAGGLIAALAASILAGGSSAAIADSGEQVCPDLSTGKIELEDGHPSIVYTAPTGHHVRTYCVKAGSELAGDGPETYRAPYRGASEVTITHSSGKDISHYSVLLCNRGTQQR